MTGFEDDFFTDKVANSGGASLTNDFVAIVNY